MKVTIGKFWLVLLASAATMLAVAAHQPVAAATASPDEAAMVRFHTIVDYDFVKDYVAFPPRADVLIVDSRPTSRKYDKGHIPGAISIPYTQFDEYKHLLPQDKNTLVIFYCGGQKCPLSHKSAIAAEKLGYKNVKVYADGYPDWVEHGNPGAVSTAYMKKLVDGGKTVVVDARPKARKYDKGHIPGAISIPDTQFDQYAASLPADKATPVVFYCGGLKCPLSDKSARKAIALGYTDVKTYPAGMPAWQETYGAQAVVEGTEPRAGSATAAIEKGTEDGTISIASFKKFLAEQPDAIMIVDVRDPVQYKAGTFKTAVNIPIDKLEKEVANLPSDKPIVFICNTGGLSGEAYDMTKLLRPELNAFFLEAELVFGKDGSYTIKPNKG